MKTKMVTCVLSFIFTCHFLLHVNLNYCCLVIQNSYHSKLKDLCYYFLHDRFVNDESSVLVYLKVSQFLLIFEVEILPVFLANSFPSA